MGVCINVASANILRMSSPVLYSHRSLHLYRFSIFDMENLRAVRAPIALAFIYTPVVWICCGTTKRCVEYQSTFADRSK